MAPSEQNPIQDPQSEPGTFCPKNRLGLRSYSDLKAFEVAAAHRRQLELDANGINGAFNAGHLRKIHWCLFRDVFPWAGEYRQVNMSKVGGAHFGSPLHIASALDEALAELKKEHHLRGLDQAVFAPRAAFYLGEINAIHPFREGNGRTQREFIRQLALQAGHLLSWAGFGEEQNTAASILSHTRGDNSGLAVLIEAAITRAATLDGSA
jgi:cell filamentation protein